MLLNPSLSFSLAVPEKLRIFYMHLNAFCSGLYYLLQASGSDFERFRITKKIN